MLLVYRSFHCYKLIELNCDLDWILYTWITLWYCQVYILTTLLDVVIPSWFFPSFPSFLSFSPTPWPSVMPSLPCSMTGLDTTQRPITLWTLVNLLQGWYRVWSSLYQVASSLDPSPSKSSPVLLLCGCANQACLCGEGMGEGHGTNYKYEHTMLLSLSVNAYSIDAYFHCA